MLNDVVVFIYVAWLDANGWQCFECIAECWFLLVVLQMLVVVAGIGCG